MMSLAHDPVDPTSDTLHTPARAPSGALHPLEHIRRQVAAALFDEPAPPSAVGRFQVLRILGAGGMGVVYAAHDPQLDRTVALKLLHPGQLSETGQLRLLREAQAMARLQHANVLAVHDAGRHGDQVYVAMEYVEGGTLADWLRAGPRPWQAIVELLAQAGAGLAAAHAAGLVHRDFKPQNILIGGGRIRISDFGLARLGAESAVELERTGDDLPAAAAAPLTRTGATLGTPAYMAPEQLAGRTATASSDQFAFCVVLFEALHGHRPFRGDSMVALLQAMEAGQVARTTRRVPRRLHAAILRGLAIDPARRFPTMDALLTALAAGRRSTRWPLALGGALLAAAVAVPAALSQRTDAPQAVPPTSAPALATTPALCQEAPLAGVWDPARAERLRAGLAAAPAEAEAMVARLDAYAARWSEARALRCAGPAEASWTDTCLVDRRRALDDLVTVATEAANTTAISTISLVTEFLPDVADCAAPSQYTTLAAEGLGPQRRIAWQGRTVVAGGYAPRALRTLREPQMGKSMESLFAAMTLGDARVKQELELAGAIMLAHDDSTEPNTFGYADPVTGEERVHRQYSPPPREATLKKLRALAPAAAAAGHADIAARAWLAMAELLEAGPHSDAERTLAWTGARTELARLPEAHQLRQRLTRDLAVIELAHARHATPAGECHAANDKFGRCEAVYRAIDDLAWLLAHADDPALARQDRELQARAHAHAGDAAAAAAARADGAAEALDEASLGYLDMSAGRVVQATPTLAEAIRCTYEHSRCVVDPALLAGEIDPEALLEHAFFLPETRDGEFVGYEVHGAKQSEILRHVDLQQRDVIVAIDGEPLADRGPGFDLEGTLQRGRLRLTLERGGATIERELALAGR